MLTDTDVAARGQALYAEVATMLRQRQQRRARLRRAVRVVAGAGVVLLGGAHLLGRDLLPWDWAACAVASFAAIGILSGRAPDPVATRASTDAATLLAARLPAAARGTRAAAVLEALLIALTQPAADDVAPAIRTAVYALLEQPAPYSAAALAQLRARLPRLPPDGTPPPPGSRVPALLQAGVAHLTHGQRQERRRAWGWTLLALLVGLSTGQLLGPRFDPVVWVLFGGGMLWLSGLLIQGLGVFDNPYAAELRAIDLLCGWQLRLEEVIYLRSAIAELSGPHARTLRAALERYERWGWLALDREILGWIWLGLWARQQRRERRRSRRWAQLNAVETILDQVETVLPPARPPVSADGWLPQQWRTLRAEAAPPRPSAPPPEVLDQWRDRLRGEQIAAGRVWVTQPPAMPRKEPSP